MGPEIGLYFGYQFELILNIPKKLVKNKPKHFTAVSEISLYSFGVKNSYNIFITVFHKNYTINVWMNCQFLYS